MSYTVEMVSSSKIILVYTRLVISEHLLPFQWHIPPYFILRHKIRFQNYSKIWIIIVYLNKSVCILYSSNLILNKKLGFFNFHNLREFFFYFYESSNQNNVNIFLFCGSIMQTEISICIGYSISYMNGQNVKFVPIC